MDESRGVRLSYSVMRGEIDFFFIYSHQKALNRNKHKKDFDRSNLLIVQQGVEKKDPLTAKESKREESVAARFRVPTIDSQIVSPVFQMQQHHSQLFQNVRTPPCERRYVTTQSTLSLSQTHTPILEQSRLERKTQVTSPKKWSDLILLMSQFMTIFQQSFSVLNLLFMFHQTAGHQHSHPEMTSQGNNCNSQIS